MPFNVGGDTLNSSMIGPNGLMLSKNFRKITPDLIDSVYTYGGQIITQGADSNGLYTITFQYDNAGCGTPDSGFGVFIKDVIPWTRVVCRFSVTGTASCWSINQSGFGGTAPNLESYNASLGDIIYTVDALNSFNVGSFQVKTYACDNDSTNFMHGGYQTGDPKTFYIFSRRSNTTSLSGPAFGRSCTSTGAGSRCTLSEIYVV